MGTLQRLLILLNAAGLQRTYIRRRRFSGKPTCRDQSLRAGPICCGPLVSCVPKGAVSKGLCECCQTSLNANDLASRKFSCFRSPGVNLRNRINPPQSEFPILNLPLGRKLYTPLLTLWLVLRSLGGDEAKNLCKLAQSHFHPQSHGP